MDAFLTRLTQQAMNYAIRSGIAITASYAIRQSSRLLKNVGGEDRDELLLLQRRLESKIHVISPAIDMIELIAARGNTSLESAVTLTKALRWDIQALGQRLAKAAAAEELVRRGAKSKDQAKHDLEIKLIIKDIRRLLDRIEDAVPLMNLAITTSGAKLSTNLPSTVSPSRLLQASTFLTTGDTQYSITPSQAIQVGPTFTLSMYMLFAGHVRPHDEESVREATWKEVIHKARLKLRRVPMDLAFSHRGHEVSDDRILAEARVDEFAYQILIIEDLDDGRVHSFEAPNPQPQHYEGVELAGVREILPIHQISKIFYADTGRILNISTEGETNNPVLLLKRDINAVPPRRIIERDENGYLDPEEDISHTNGDEDEETDELQAQLDAQLNIKSTGRDEELPSFHESSIPEEWRLPSGLDPEWIAFEVYNEEEDSDTESEGEPIQPTEAGAVDSAQMARLSLKGRRRAPVQTYENKPSESASASRQAATTLTNPLFNNIRTSLSLLEMLLRLMSLQQFQQQSHLSISDELLNFFLEESSTTGAGGDEQHRQRLRTEARRRVGWDPYDESPVKRRGEDYQYRGGTPVSYSRDTIEDYAFSPSDRTRLFQIRSRANTPESPSAPQEKSPSMPPEASKRALQSSRRSTPLAGKDRDRE
ncbi:hypothetical protein ASPZODRAFT_128811 [Penicilliopsis zonata CBS 506.65]|uniref:RanGTP-binding protein n=1 Tax=Penicilliopsis zonata CBS 506.65 TaxID=1073090 RepID=A0A1L9SSN3_9EURO|nr:hypothetical protein ASPZODRAFT_128811 [Penicilliopsis zonata CBS 506.65]OJJ50189.1 hypothetical protein ASPZODRAFT_128811 [Penicilliopsis zonata CBS 506.65]